MIYETVARIRRVAGDWMLISAALGRHTWFDHRIDEMLWPRDIFWVERGVLARLYLPQGGKVLDACCGDGYFSDVFWSETAGTIEAIDRDAAALSTARRFHGRPNIAFYQRDVVRDALPGSNYDLVCFFEAIEHLSATDGKTVIDKLRSALARGGHIVGSTPQVADDDRSRRNREHDNEFESAEGLQAFLGPGATILTTHHVNRTTLYFVCGSSGHVAPPVC